LYSLDIGIVLHVCIVLLNVLYFLDIGIVLHVCIVLLNVWYFCICFLFPRYWFCTAVLSRYWYGTAGCTVKCFIHLDIGIVLHVCIVLLNVLYFLDICIVRHAGCTVECFVLPRYLYCTDGYTVKCFVLLRYLFCTAYLLYC